MQPTPNQKAIYKLLTTSTGSALGDSGGAYGRHWERNQKRTIQDFMNDPKVSVELTHYLYDGNTQTESYTEAGMDITKYHYDETDNRIERVEYSYTISLFHWLDRYFDIANEKNNTFVSKFNRLKKGKHDYIEDRQDEYLESIGYQKGDTMNSCNGDSDLSQVYTLTPVYPIDEEYDFCDHTYYLLSIHQGCDVRGGYTTDIMVKLDPNDYPSEYVYGDIQYIDEAEPVQVSNTYDGYRIRNDETDTEIEPERITSLTLSI